jgi:hydrogenase expression/formation protein HypE
LIEQHIRPALDNPLLSHLPDAAQIVSDSTRLAVTADSFVVSPLFFPGGDIGSLSVHGTVNDLAVAGARPRWITLSMIIEEGLPLAILDRVLQSVAETAGQCGVVVAAGDTKVVPRGAADGLFLNTTGIGELIDPVPSGPSAIEQDDILIVSGPVGRHGIAVLCAREELGLQPPPVSDAGSLIEVVDVLRATGGGQVRAIRDATRGGVSAVLHEWAVDCDWTFRLNQGEIPVSPDVRGACEILGLDPLQVACEGTLVAAVAPDVAEPILQALRRLTCSAHAAAIGAVTRRRISPVTIQRTLGNEQPLDEPSGAPLPRIC